MGSYELSEMVEELYELEAEIMENRQARLQWGDEKVGRYNSLKREICGYLGKKPEDAFDFLAEITGQYRERLEEAKEEIAGEYQDRLDDMKSRLEAIAKHVRPYLLPQEDKKQ